MRRLLITTFIFGSLLVAGSANVQMPAPSGVEGMGNFFNTQVDWNEVVEHTAREEQEGKELWNKLQAKEVACENLGDEQYGVLGEYFMGWRRTDSHCHGQTSFRMRHIGGVSGGKPRLDADDKHDVGRVVVSLWQQ